jgi:hypothetical protein
MCETVSVTLPSAAPKKTVDGIKAEAFTRNSLVSLD